MKALLRLTQGGGTCNAELLADERPAPRGVHHAGDEEEDAHHLRTQQRIHARLALCDKQHSHFATPGLLSTALQLHNNGVPVHSGGPAHTRRGILRQLRLPAQHLAVSVDVSRTLQVSKRTTLHEQSGQLS